LIDGKAIAETIRGELKAEVEQLQQQFGKARPQQRTGLLAGPGCVQGLRFPYIFSVGPEGAPPCCAGRLQMPGLAVVLVGERKDSQTYVRNKKKACEEVGIKSFGTDLPETATEEEVLKVSGQGGLQGTAGLLRKNCQVTRGEVGVC
jgi:hypothetical protein